jgi:Protein of unknown function (DUF1588)/Protein of unknown function (DUF1592)/Protein of unknown function (DUF1587)/Protein of unknown function (DUF1595)/Protein of unknown function (DUF1585)
VGGGDGSSTEPLSCDLPTPGAAPLHPLSRFQYDNAVRDLFGDTTRPARVFPPENEVLGYRTFASANVASPLLVESYLSAAEGVAARAVERVSEIAPCAEGQELAACGTAFLRALTTRAFRRPATAEELAPLQGLLEQGLLQSYEKGVELVVQAVLQAPQFLYRVQSLRSATPESGATALGPYELASRLSFTLWGSVPDEELLGAAAEGRLTTPADVEREAWRLLSDGRARDIVHDFSEQWLGLSRLQGAVREGGGEAGPELLSASLRQSLDRYLDDAYFGSSGRFERLFSSPQVWLDGTLAPLFGAALPVAGFEARTMADPRRGLLTQPGLMALLAHSDQTAPVIRGAFIRERILCTPVPAPPPNVNTIPPDPDPTATTRERFRQHTEQAACAACHRLIDGIGFGFERYDQLGRYRATENGLDVDESGEVFDIREPGLDGPFSGALELSLRIAQSPKARDCLATNWYRYSFGRQEQAEDTCSLTAVRERFAESGGNLKELLVALTQTDAFLYRPAITEAP